ncbi:hypothetical protein [Enterobacter ludwigii]
MLRLITVFLIIFSAIPSSYGWSGIQHETFSCVWQVRNAFNCGVAPLTFDYNPQDKPHFSMTKPSSAADGIEIKPNQWIRPGNGDAVRFQGELSNGSLTPIVGADTDNDLDGFHSGTFYAWYGKDGILYEYKYTSYYTPIAQVSLSSSVIDLGTCIKSGSDTGKKLEKQVNIPITLRGYAPDASFSFSRVIKSSNSPDAVSYWDKNHKKIDLGKQNVLINSLSGTFPQKMDDKISVSLECDKISTGEHTWALNIEYIIP